MVDSDIINNLKPLLSEEFTNILLLPQEGLNFSDEQIILIIHS